MQARAIAHHHAPPLAYLRLLALHFDALCSVPHMYLASSVPSSYSCLRHQILFALLFCRNVLL